MILSVVMAVYNGEKYIKESIDSVLNQSFTDFEFIIVNDGSTDDTTTILSGYTDKRMQIIHQKNVGLSKSLNRGIEIAKGKYIARMDADDRCKIDRFKKQLDYLSVHTDVVLLGSNSNVMDEEGNLLYRSNVLPVIENIEVFAKFSPFIHSSVIFKKQSFIACGGYPEDIIHHFEDLILWKKMFSCGKLANITEALIFYRITPNGITNKTKKAFVLQKKIIDAYLEGKGVNETAYGKLINLTNLRSYKRHSLYHNRIAKIYLINYHDRKRALKHIKLSLKNTPFNLSALKLLVYSLLFTSYKPKQQNIQ